MLLLDLCHFAVVTWLHAAIVVMSHCLLRTRPTVRSLSHDCTPTKAPHPHRKYAGRFAFRCFQAGFTVTTTTGCGTRVILPLAACSGQEGEGAGTGGQLYAGEAVQALSCIMYDFLLLVGSVIPDEWSIPQHSCSSTKQRHLTLHPCIHAPCSTQPAAMPSIGAESRHAVTLAYPQQQHSFVHTSR